MNETQQTLNVGRDPRMLPEYDTLRSEINKLSHTSRPQVDWTLIHHMAQLIFERQGVDLQTAVYFTLARSRLHGLQGFTEGCEFLANLVVTQWENVWPPVHQARARVEMLDWFIARVSDVVRQYPIGQDDKRLIYRCERALQLMSEKLHNTGLERVPRVENLLQFIEGYTHLFDETEIVIVSQEQDSRKQVMQVPPMVYFRSDETEDADAESMALPAGSLVVGREKGTLKPRILKIEPHKKSRPGGFWFVCGVLSGLLPVMVFATWNAWHQAQVLRQGDAVAALEAQALSWPAAPDAARLSDIRLALGEQTLRSMEAPLSREYQAQLMRVQQLSPLWPYQYADTLRSALRMLYPQSLALSAMDSQWQQKLNEQRDTARLSSQTDVSLQVDTLLTTLQSLEQQHKSVTISYLKSSLYEIQKTATRDTPFETRLRELETRKRGPQPLSPAELKAMEEKLKSLNVRLYALTLPGQAS